MIRFFFLIEKYGKNILAPCLNFWQNEIFRNKNDITIWKYVHSCFDLKLQEETTVQAMPEQFECLEFSEFSGTKKQIFSYTIVSKMAFFISREYIVPELDCLPLENLEPPLSRDTTFTSFLGLPTNHYIINGNGACWLPPLDITQAKRTRIKAQLFRLKEQFIQSIPEFILYTVLV